MSKDQFILIVVVAFSGLAATVLVFGPIFAAMRRGYEELERTRNPGPWIFFAAIVGAGIYFQLPH
jgi:hypothetical protein